MIHSRRFWAARPAGATQLLVSVRNGEEARCALDGGADIIDAKEPTAGALGAVSLDTFVSIVAAVAGAVPVSAAVGDAEDEWDVEARALAFGGAGAAFIKVGFAGINGSERIASMIAAARRGAASTGAGVVAVAYADHADIAAPSPAALASVAARSGAAGVLLDTALKDGPGLMSLMAGPQVAAWIRHVREAGMFAAVAGRLCASDLSVVRTAVADIAGVRGAACEGGRSGAVTVSQVRQLVRALRDPVPHTWSTEHPAAAPAESTDPRSSVLMRPNA